MDINVEQEIKALLEVYKPIILVKTGSELYGLNDENSDTDLIGVFVEPMSKLVGFSPEDTIIYRSAERRTGIRDAKSEKGDTDLTLYGLRKFLQLACIGNPNLHPIAFAPVHMIIDHTEIGKELREIYKKHVISKNMLKSALGMSDGQVQRASKLQFTKYENIEQGKKLYITSLLALQAGLELVNHNCVQYPLYQGDTYQYMTNLKKGVLGFSHIKAFIDQRKQLLEERLAEDTEDTMPRKPRYEEIEKWMLGVYQREWQKTP